MAIGSYRHVVTVQDPTALMPDGEGGWTEGWADLDPAKWDVSIIRATARDLERVGAGTILTTATHVIEGRYREDVSLTTRLLFEGRVFAITGIDNVEERDITLRLIAEEQI